MSQSLTFVSCLKVAFCNFRPAEVLESSHVLEVHLYSASASCSCQAVDLAARLYITRCAPQRHHQVVDRRFLHNPCTILALSFAMPWSLRFFFPAIFIFVDRMLLSTHQELYLSLKHVKLLPRLSGWVRLWANSHREVHVLTLSLLAHTTEHCYQEEKQLCKPKCLKPW